MAKEEQFELTLICARLVADELDAIPHGLRCEVGAWSPGVGAIVWVVLNKSRDWDGIAGWPLEEDKVDRAAVLGGWLPDN